MDTAPSYLLVFLENSFVSEQNGQKFDLFLVVGLFLAWVYAYAPAEGQNWDLPRV